MPAVATEVITPPETDTSGLQGRMIDGKWNGKYNIYDPTKIKYAERTEFLKGTCGHIDHEDTLEDLLRMYPAGKFGQEAARFELLELAQIYYKYRNKGARLPKFSKWIMGMFAGNASYAKILAEEGQKAAKRKIIMSVDLIDILRCADTKHFASCFQKGGFSTEYSKVPIRIAEECPGIGIVYVDDEDGYMMGRQWMHHAKIVDTGEDIIVLTASQYGCLDGQNVARLMAERGIKVGVGSYYGDEVHGDEIVKVEYVGCFTSNIHHDLVTWGKGPHKVAMIKPAFTKKSQ